MAAGWLLAPADELAGPEAAAEVAAAEELLGAPAPEVEAPNPAVALVPGAVEPKPSTLSAAAEEEEGRGVLTATPNALEVLGAAELAGVEAGKLREKDGVAAVVLVAGEGVSPSDGPDSAADAAGALNIVPKPGVGCGPAEAA